MPEQQNIEYISIKVYPYSVPVSWLDISMLGGVARLGLSMRVKKLDFLNWT